MPPELFEVYKRLMAVEGTVRWMRWLWMTLGAAFIVSVISLLVALLAGSIRSV